LNLFYYHRLVCLFCWRITGQCFLSYILSNGNKPIQISINEINTFSYPVEYDKFVTRDEIIALLTTVLASNIFERHYCGSVSSLSNNDNKILQIIDGVLRDNNMLTYTSLSSHQNYQNAVNTLLGELEYFVVKIIHEHDTIIRKLQSELFKLETLHQIDIINIIGMDTLNSFNI